MEVVVRSVLEAPIIQETNKTLLIHIADPFAEADEDGTSEAKQSQNYIHIRIQRESLELNTEISWIDC